MKKPHLGPHRMGPSHHGLGAKSGGSAAKALVKAAAKAYAARARAKKQAARAQARAERLTKRVVNYKRPNEAQQAKRDEKGIKFSNETRLVMAIQDIQKRADDQGAPITDEELAGLISGDITIEEMNDLLQEVEDRNYSELWYETLAENGGDRDAATAAFKELTQ